MSCNCATQEQIKKLYDLYGDKNNRKISKHQKIKNFIRNFVIFIFLVVISPFLITLVLYHGIFTKDKKISVRKILRFNKKGIDEAIAKNIIENTNIAKNE